MVRTREDAARIIAELPASCGLDCRDDAASRSTGSPRPWIAITKKGERAKHQPELKDKSGLDPHKARVRMIQVYSPEHEAVFLFDLDHLSIETLAELGLFSDRKFVAHNAAFECDDAAGARARHRADRQHAARRPGARLRASARARSPTSPSRSSASSCPRSSSCPTGAPSSCRTRRSTTPRPMPSCATGRRGRCGAS